MSTRKRFLDQMYEITDQTPGDKVREAYDQWSDTYDHELVDENAYATPRRAAETVFELRPKLSEDRILDIGCGTGLSGAALKAVGANHIDGCDFSAGMLAKAEERAVYGRLFQADLNSPPIDVDTGYYDVVVAVGVFAHAHLGETALVETLRCVKPGGVLLVTTNDHFYETGILQRKLDHLTRTGAVTMLCREHGSHIPGRDIGGWVFAMLKAAD